MIIEYPITTKTKIPKTVDTEGPKNFYMYV